MRQQFAISLGHFSGRINAGLVDEDGAAFTSKEDCTEQALLAVAAYVLRQDGPVTVTDGRSTVRITVEDV